MRRLLQRLRKQQALFKARSESAGWSAKPHLFGISEGYRRAADALERRLKKEGK